MVAMRHMHQYGTTPEQLAWVARRASHHAQHKPQCHAARRGHGGGRAGLADDLDPLHKLDCCVVSDGGGALIVARPEIAATPQAAQR